MSTFVYTKEISFEISFEWVGLGVFLPLLPLPEEVLGLFGGCGLGLARGRR